MFDSGGERARRSDPRTSHEAAASVVSSIPLSCRTMLRVLQQWPDEMFDGGELAGWCQMERSIAARRRKDLVEAGMIRPVIAGGTQAMGTATSGRRVLLWELTEEGMAFNVDGGPRQCVQRSLLYEDYEPSPYDGTYSEE